MSFKWICGWIGWISTHSVLGGIVGFVIGSVIDSAKGSKSDADSGYSQGGRGDAYTGGNTYSEDFPHDPRVGERNSFLFSLMVLSAHVIQADGRILDSELRFVRGFLRTNFGADAESDGERILNKLFEYRRINGETTWRNQIYQACREMAAHMIPEHRLQLISLLCEISKADGHVADAEVTALREIATNLGLYAGVVDQMLHMGGASLDDDYALLGIDKNATDDEVRKAYRKMAMQHHPDRVATLGEDIKCQAQKKFQEINAAKDRIYKSRNMQ